MTFNDPITWAEALRLLGRNRNPQLDRWAMDRSGIPSEKIGSALVIDRSELPKLAATYEEWNSRPRIRPCKSRESPEVADCPS